MREEKEENNIMKMNKQPWQLWLRIVAAVVTALLGAIGADAIIE